MRIYHFTEHPYPNAWDDPHGYLRVDLPNRALAFADGTAQAKSRARTA